jgi:hypothetical protein
MNNHEEIQVPSSAIYQWKKHMKKVHPKLFRYAVASVYEILRWTWRKVRPK